MIEALLIRDAALILCSSVICTWVYLLPILFYQPECLRVSRYHTVLIREALEYVQCPKDKFFFGVVLSSPPYELQYQLKKNLLMIALNSFTFTDTYGLNLVT